MKSWWIWSVFILIVIGEPTQAATDIDSLLLVLEAENDAKKQVDLYEDIANKYLVTALDSSIIFAQKGLQRARSASYTKGVIRCLNIIGNYYERKTAYQKSMQQYEEALNLAKVSKDTPSLAIVINNIAIIHTRTGAYQEAIKLYFEALEMEEATKNQKGIAETYNNIGVIYFYQRQMDKTIEYLEKSLAIEEQLNDPTILKKGYNNLGAICDYTGEHQKALAYYRKSYRLSQQLEDKQEMSINLANMAVAYYHLDSMKTSEEYHQKSIALKQQLGDQRGIAHAYSNYAALYKSQEKWEKAEELYQQSLKIGLEAPYKEIEIEVYKSLADLYEKQDNPTKANQYLHQYILGRDSFLNEKNNAAIAEMESKYQAAQKEKEILEQQLELDKKTAAIAKKNRQLWSIGAVLALLSLLGIVFYQRHQRLKKEYALQQAEATLETQKKLDHQRLHIARDLHDNIGSQLTFLISTIGNLQYRFRDKHPVLQQKLEYMNTFVKQTIQELRDTIWAMNKDMIYLQDLEERLQHYFEKARYAAPQLVLEIKWDSQIDKKLVLNSVEGMQVYRIVQEAVNNTIKYADAQKVSLIVQQTETTLSYTIVDDGIGFEVDAARGNGLHNMKKRANEIGATVTIKAKSGEGTKIELQVPTNKM